MRAKNLFAFGLTAALAAGLAGPAAARDRPPADPLDLASGAVIVEFSSQYGGGEWSAMATIDGTTKTGWSSAQGAPFPHRFVIELARRLRLTTFTIDNSTAQESGYPGISAKDIEIQVSASSAAAGFRRVLLGQARRGARTVFRLPPGTEARWLAVLVHSNWGHQEYTEIMEFEAAGAPVGAPPPRPPVSGVYGSNYGPILISQQGGFAGGCYYGGSGWLTGSTDGRVLKLEWRQDHGRRFGATIMVLTSAGDFLNGLWYEGGKLAGAWYGARAAPGTSAGCRAATGNPFARAIEESGRAIVYGINFDFDSARLQPNSAPTLGRVLAVLQAKPGLRLAIEGHTDSVASDSYNLKLSTRRAQAVAAWLGAKGVARGRLQPVGKGESEPVAENHTPQGRALNRRVVIRALKQRERPSTSSGRLLRARRVLGHRDKMTSCLARRGRNGTATHARVMSRFETLSGQRALRPHCSGSCPLYDQRLTLAQGHRRFCS